MDVIEDTGFEAHVIGLADSRSLTLSLEAWQPSEAAAASVEAGLRQQHGVLHVSVDTASGSAEVGSCSMQLIWHP